MIDTILQKDISKIHSIGCFTIISLFIQNPKNFVRTLCQKKELIKNDNFHIVFLEWRMFHSSKTSVVLTTWPFFSTTKTSMQHHNLFIFTSFFSFCPLSPNSSAQYMERFVKKFPILQWSCKDSTASCKILLDSSIFCNILQDSVNL